MRTTGEGHGWSEAQLRLTAHGSSVDGTIPSGEFYDAFICYKRISVDEQFVDHLCQALAERDQPKTVWVDRKRIEPAAKWLGRVTRAIEASRAVIYVMTPESVASEDCHRELVLATERNKLIIPIRLRDVPDRTAVHPQVSAANWILADPEGVPDSLVDEVVRALEDDLDWRDRHAYLGARAAQWHSQKRKRGFLLQREELQDAETWLRQAVRHPKVAPTPLHRDYITAGRKAENRSRNRVIVGLCAGLAVALTLAGVAFVQGQDARNSARIANARALAAESTADLASNPQQSLSLALQGMKTDSSGPEIQALRLALAQDRLRMTIGTGAGASALAAWDGTLSQVAVTAPHNSIALWDTATGKLLQTLPTGHAVSQILYNSSGTRLAAVSSAGYVSMWNVSAAGRATSIYTSQLNEEIRADTPSPDSSGYGSLISGSWADGNGGQFEVTGAGLADMISYSLSAGSARNVVSAQTLGAWESIPSPDGTQWFLGGGEDNLLNPLTGQLTPIPADLASGGGACWLADGSAVFTTLDSGVTGSEALYRATTGGVIAQFPQSQPTTSVACSASPDNQWVAAGDEVGDLYLRLAGGRVISLYGDDDEITSMESSLDGRYLATASADGTARIWNTTTGQLVTTLTGDGAPLTSVQFGVGNGLVLTVDKSGFVRIWDTQLGEPTVALQEPTHGEAIPYGFTSNGTLITGADVITSSGPNAQVTQASALTWNARTGRLLRQIPLPGIVDAPVLCSSTLQTWGRGMAAEMFPASGCSLPPPPDLDVEAVVSRPDSSQSYGPVMELLPMAASPDGKYEAYTRQGEVNVLDTDGHQVAQLRLNGTPDGLSFYDGDASVMVVTATDIYLWRPLSGQRPLIVPQPGPPTDATVSGGLLAAAEGGKAVGVWNASTGKLIRSFTPSSSINGQVTLAVPLRVALTGNGAVVAAGSDDGSVRLWNISTGKLIAQDSSDGYVIELTAATSGSVLAVDWPAIGAHGPFSPVNGEVIAGSTGQVLATYTANNQVQPSISPGAALSPDGGFILAGTDGIAPTPPGGTNAVYQVSSGQTMTGLQSAAANQAALYSYAESPASPWSPDGTKILIGTAVYACDACGDPTALKDAAASRLAWAKPLSAAADHPPVTSPYY
jgi:WD40 repeat protein